MQGLIRTQRMFRRCAEMIFKITCPDCGYIEEVKIGKSDEIVLRIPKDEAEKLRYALDHVQLTGDWHIDATLDTLNEVLKEELSLK